MKAFLTALSLAALLVGACSSTTPEGGSETNWVDCDEVTPCSAGFRCKAGRCEPASEEDSASRVTVLSDMVPGEAAPVGAACIPGDMTNPDFPGFSAHEVNVETGGSQCEGGVCLVAHFQGRPGCPYGQVANAGTCLTSGPDPVPVTVYVGPQLVERSPDESIYCTCRCDGPGPGPFCACPSGFSCEPAAPDFFEALPEDLAGSYCVKDGIGVVLDPVVFSNMSRCLPGQCDGR